MTRSPSPLEQTPPRLDVPSEELVCAPELSVVVPTLDEAATIVELLTGIRSVAERLGVAHEVLVVDGGSADGTGRRRT